MEAEGVTYGRPDEARVALDPSLVVLAKEAHAGDGTRDDKLDGEDGVDFADELIADIEGCLGHTTAKLYGCPC